MNIKPPKPIFLTAKGDSKARTSLVPGLQGFWQKPLWSIPGRAKKDIDSN